MNDAQTVVREGGSQAASALEKKNPAADPLGPIADFPRIKRLPPYVFAVVNDLKMAARHRGEDIIDLGMGNPDQPTPRHIVEKLLEAAPRRKNHRYSVSRGIFPLRRAISAWYKRRYDVEFDPDSEAIVTMGAKEGISHLVFATVSAGDVVFVPTPTYPIHSFSVVLADGNLVNVPLGLGIDFFENLQRAFERTWPRPKMLILSFPHNPTTAVVERDFFEKVVAFARENRIWVIHDLAYSDIVFDGYRAPSFLEVPGAREVGVEFVSLTKSYNMAGWRVAFCVGNRHLVQTLGRIKSYLDYGIFQPLQIAAVIALEGPQDCVGEIAEVYRQRRDCLCDGLARAGWHIPKPRGTMFVWAEIPEAFRKMGSLEFAKLLVREAKVAVSPGSGFGPGGEGFVRFALVENQQRIRQAIRGIRDVLARTG